MVCFKQLNQTAFHLDYQSRSVVYASYAFFLYALFQLSTIFAQTFRLFLIYPAKLSDYCIELDGLLKESLMNPLSIFQQCAACNFRDGGGRQSRTPGITIVLHLERP